MTQAHRVAALIKLKAGHYCGPVTVEIEHDGNGRKYVMFEQDNDGNMGDLISMDFDEIDLLIEYLTEQQEKFR